MLAYLMQQEIDGLGHVVRHTSKYIDKALDEVSKMETIAMMDKSIQMTEAAIEIVGKYKMMVQRMELTAHRKTPTIICKPFRGGH